VTPPEEQQQRKAARRGRGLRAFLWALLGALIGGPLGYVAGALMAELLVCRNGGGAYGESCGMASMIFSFLGIPFGAAVGATLGVYAIVRQPPDAASRAEAGADASPARER
jgi:hypothetical protein